MLFSMQHHAHCTVPYLVKSLPMAQKNASFVKLHSVGSILTDPGPTFECLTGLTNTVMGYLRYRCSITRIPGTQYQEISEKKQENLIEENSGVPVLFKRKVLHFYLTSLTLGTTN